MRPTGSHRRLNHNKYSQIDMDLLMKTILVTGGAGFVGSHTCKALARAGYLPVTLDNLERGHRWAGKWGPFEQADLWRRGHTSFERGSPSAARKSLLILEARCRAYAERYRGGAWDSAHSFAL